MTERTVAQILSEVAQYDTTGEVRALYERALLGGF
jgi:phage I-like protein